MKQVGKYKHFSPIYQRLGQKSLDMQDLFSIFEPQTSQLKPLQIFYTRATLRTYLKEQQTLGRTIGFVPTMGALHEGHLSLIKLAAEQTDLVVCSIFVNPTQFNDPKDLEKYPRPVESDIQKLEQSPCDVLFMPQVEEMYQADEKWQLELDGLDEILEGEHRPGHYQGVTQIVKKLFDAVAPDLAFFGQKDFQQFLVIAKMVEKLGLPVKLVMCPIIRESDGLAMSSRNIHLSVQERTAALAISRTLFWMKEQLDKMPLIEIKEQAAARLAQSPGLTLEYLEICDTEHLHPINSENAEKMVALVAAKVGQTRLIDNILLK